MSIPPPSRRIQELDALRALAALNLVLFHFTHVYEVKYGYSTGLGFEWPYGKYGVALFFMLSGLVNAMTIARRTPGEFIKGRLIRIAPMYWIAIGLNVWLLTLWPINAGVAWDQLLANLTIMPNLFGYANMEPVTWTLQIEMLFYAWLTVMVVTGALRSPLRTIMGYLPLCIVGCMSVAYLQQHHAEATVTGGLTLVREVLLLQWMPLFGIGMLLNEVVQRRGRLWANAGGILLCLIVFHLIDYRNHNPAAMVLLIGLMVGAAYGKLPVLRFKPLLMLSTISYSLFLLHNNLGCVAIYHLDVAGLSPIMALGVTLALVTLVAWAANTWIERPLTGALQRWLGKAPARSRAVAQPTSPTN